MTEEEQKRLVKIRLEKSTRPYDLIDQLAESDPDFAINRCYYSLFYAVSALLISKGEDARTHKGLLSKFNQLFIKTGEFSKDDGRLLTKVFQWRTKADYDDDNEFTTDKVTGVKPLIEELLTKVKEKIVAN